MADSAPIPDETEASARKPFYRQIGGGLTVFLIIAFPMWREFREPGNLPWNVFLGVLMIAMVVGAFIGQRYFLEHAGEIGEARFDTRNRSDLDG